MANLKAAVIFLGVSIFLLRRSNVAGIYFAAKVAAVTIRWTVFFSICCAFSPGIEMLFTLYYQGPAKLRDLIRFRIELPIRDSIRSDDPIRNFRIVRTVNRPLKEAIGGG